MIGILRWDSKRENKEKFVYEEWLIDVLECENKELKRNDWTKCAIIEEEIKLDDDFVMKEEIDHSLNHLVSQK